MDRSQQWSRVLTAADWPQTTAERSTALQMAVELGSRLAPASLGCSITARAGDGYWTVASANGLSLALDRAQYAEGAGPCLVAAEQGVRQYVDIRAEAARFPAYVAAALARGVRGSLSIPVPVPRRDSALNLYAATPAAFEPDDAAAADLLSRCVAFLLPDGAPAVAPGEPGVSRSRRDRMVRAVEAVMAADGVSHATAFATLARRSQVERRSVHGVADDVLAGTHRTEAP